MKRIRLLALLLIAIGLAVLCACSAGDELPSPRGVTVEYETLTLRWDESAEATKYTIRIEKTGGDSTLAESSRNYYSLESLDPGEYSISVRADGKDGKSDFSRPVSFIRDEEGGLVFRLLEDGYELSDKGDATGKITVPAVYRNRPVISVGEKAFFNGTDITEVVLPESIKNIGPFAFANCTDLERINLPRGLSSLGESAFSGCRMLSGELILPENLTEIPKSAFAYCSKIEEVSFGGKLVSIGDNAFTDMSSLKKLSFPSSLREVGGFAFAACADLTEISFGEGLTRIGEFAFSKAISLNTVSLPNSLEVIEKGAFYYCSGLSEITFGEKISEVGDSAFLETKVYNSSNTNEIYVCNWFVGLKDITAPAVSIKDGTVGIANGAMYANKYVAAVELPDSVEYIGNNAFAVSNLVSIVMGSGVRRIGDQAFLYCESLIDVIPGSYDYEKGRIKESSLEYIGNYAFMNCTKLSDIEIPDSVEDIGSYAFRNTEIYNSALTGAVYAGNWIVDFNKTITEELVVDKGTAGIARYAFYNCTDLRKIKIDSDVKVIGRGAFYCCTSLESVTLPDELRRIEDYTFYGCSSLTRITLPPMLREIGRSAFYMCGSAGNGSADTENDVLNIPAGVTYIGDFAFFGCGYRAADSIDGETETSGIDAITMGDKIEYIGKYAFRGFASLKRVVIAGADIIGDGAFFGCPSLEEITVSGGLVSVGEKAFYKCTALRTVSFPDTLATLGNYSFYMCESLKTAELGIGLVKIGDYAFFGNTALESLTLPTGTECIGKGAFRGCLSIVSLALGESVKEVGAHAFYSCNSLTIYLDADTDTSLWSAEWNSSYLPVVTECEISDGGYLISVTGTDAGIINKFRDTVVSPPARAGYTFVGWSRDAASDAVEYPTEYISELGAGEKLYPVFRPYGEDTDSVT